MSDPLKELTEQLAEVGKLLQQTNERVVTHLVDRKSKPPDGNDESSCVDVLSAKIDGLAERLDVALQSPQEPADSPDSPPVAEAVSGGNEIREQFEALTGRLDRIEQQINAGWQHVVEQLRPPQTDQNELEQAEPACNTDWHRAILGSDLADHAGLDAPRRQLIEAVLAGDPGACSFAGEMLVFRSAMTDKMPPLLKDIGEAYYRWRPKCHPGTDPMEEALIAWLRETMQDAGIANSIELVHPGERFDSTRHTSTSRGVEIAEVRGWIVLRDNGRVYTKASVAVK